MLRLTSAVPPRTSLVATVFCLAAVLAPPAVVAWQDAPLPPLRYNVDFSDTVNHYITVRMTSLPTGPVTTLMMPVWTPGSYLVREYARHVDRVTASSASGEPLSVTKISKNRWEVTTPAQNEEFSVEYRVYCNEMSVRTNMVDRGMAVLNGAATFITFPERLAAEHRVTLALPKRWSRSASSMKTADGDPSTYIATSFDELVDSPIVAGNIELFPFEVGGVPHFLVNVNDRGNWDGDRAAGDLARLVLAHQQLWGCVPYDRYYFINVIGDQGGGGLEHDNSTLMLASSYAMRDERSYTGWLSLASHEFFHVWNVRRLRPKELVRYDYESEVYTPNLWVAEGLTTYYEDLLMSRAELIQGPTLVGGLGGQIRSLQTSPGRLVQSLRDSSHDAWIKFYRPADNSDATEVSYYNKGAVVGLLLDTRIRAATSGAASLDEVLRRLYQRHSGPVGYTYEDFLAICNEVAGTDLTEWLDRAVNTTEELDYQELADWFGLQVGDILPAGASPPAPTNEREERQARWIGIGESGSPASKAGLSPDDELIAINDRRIEGNFNSLLQEFEVGDPIKMLISRDGKIQEALLTVAARPKPANWNLRIYRRSSREQKNNLENWLTGSNSDSNEAEGEESADTPPESADTPPATTDPPEAENAATPDPAPATEESDSDGQSPSEDGNGGQAGAI